MKLRNWIAILGFGFLATHSLVAQAQWNPSSVNPQARAKATFIYNEALKAFANGDYPTTLKLCKAGENFDSANKELFNLEALAYAQAGDNYMAMTKFRQALSLDYNYITCRNNFGVFLNRTGKREEAKKAFEECNRIDPRYPDAYYHLGQIYEAEGDLDKAVEAYNTAVQLNPNYADAQRDLGLAIYQRVLAGMSGELEPAIDKLKTAARLAPESPLVHYHLARVLCATSKLDEAEAEFRTALIKDSRMAAADYELGRLRYFRGDPYRSIDGCILAEQVSPSYSESKGYPKVDLVKLTELMAKSYEAALDLEHADTCYRKLATLQSSNVETVRHIKQIEKQLKINQKKRSKLTVNPQEVQSMVDKGINQFDNGDLDGAKQSFERAIELDPHSFGGLQNLGETLEAKGDLNGAMAKYQAAIAAQPGFDGCYYNAAYVLEKMGLPADAGLMYQKFHELAGKYPYDSKHIVSLQQDDARQRAKDQMIRQRGF
jgi:tetratricopeptide (TPR) repeat protein